VCEFAGLESAVRSANKSASVMNANTAGSMQYLFLRVGVCVCDFAGLDSAVRSANKSASVMKANTAGSMQYLFLRVCV